MKKITPKMLDVLQHTKDESSGHSDRATLKYLYGQGYGRTVGALQRQGLVYWYNDELWITKKGRTLCKT
jgi:hypothetical protein